MMTMLMKRSSVLVHLPDEILENIFSFLPLKSAIRVSILSRGFNNWLSKRNLYMGREFARRRLKEAYIDAVERRMEGYNHSKLFEFRLSFDPTGELPRTNEWIRFARSRGVEELDLDFSATATRGTLPFKITTNAILGRQTIIAPRLASCNISKKVPFNLDLPNLSTLSLSKMKQGNCLEMRECSLGLWPESFKEIASASLQSLVLVDCEFWEGICLVAPKLSRIEICGRFPKVDFLSSVSNVVGLLAGIMKTHKRRTLPQAMHLLE
ncbi:hypothetical protein ACLOJK_015181 [Asimina triloba]